MNAKYHFSFFNKIKKILKKNRKLSGLKEKKKIPSQYPVYHFSKIKQASLHLDKLIPN